MLILDGSDLTPDQIERVATGEARVRLGADAREAVARNRAALERALADPTPRYGVNTGFGALARQRILPEDLEQLQRNLIRSHAAGAGEPLHARIVRAMLTVLAASLARARSGVRPELIDRLAGVLNAGLAPVVPESGSVGASGDLAPLAHAALTLMGEGELWDNGRRRPATEALRDAGLDPVTPGAKEGLALINGTHLMAGRMALIVRELERVRRAALIACAISIDAARATHAFLDERVYAARRQPGPRRVAERLRALLSGSGIVRSHADDDPRVQDPYSFRCAPMIMGPAFDAIDAASDRLADELAAVTDNPLVFETQEGGVPEIVSAGCFHGTPVALPLDTLPPAAAHLANAAERRMFHILSAFDPESRLSAFLSPRPGVMSGFMVVQYTAAAMCNELIGLSTPASVANIPTCAGMEDVNSFGPYAAAKAHRAAALLRSVVACELLVAAEAVEAHRPHRSGGAAERAVGIIRADVPRLDRDRPPAPDIAAIERLIDADRFAEIEPVSDARP